MQDPRVGLLVFLGEAWPAVLLMVGFVVVVRQTYGAWEDQRAWAAQGWIAGPVVLAVLGLSASLVLLLAVPSVDGATPHVMGTVFSAVLAPVGPALQVAAALLLATAPVAWWRTRAFAGPEAVHAGVACLVLSLALASFAADVEIHRALLAHAGAVVPDVARIAELERLTRITGPLVQISVVLASFGAATWAMVPVLRQSGRDVARWVAPVAVLALSVYSVAALRTGALLP